MNQVGNINPGQLESFIQRIERLEDEKKNIAQDIKEVYSEAKAMGYDVKIMRQIIKLRGMDQADRIEMEMLLDTYKKALNLSDEETNQAAEEI
ncbi:MAG: DUF2312 domain-containing protein [Alphaproteobacteria bacterium]